MKKLLLLLLICLNSSCKDFLTDFSQDLVIVKTTTDLDELMLGSAYLPSKVLNSFVSAQDVCPFLNLIDDDVNTVIGTTRAFQGGWDPWLDPYIFGYTTWQLEVSRSYDKSVGYPDDLTWTTIYNRINVVNMILSELKNVPRQTDSDKRAAVRIQGEALFLRAQYYLLLSNLYGDAYHPATAATQLTVPLKLTEFVEHQGNAPLQFNRATAKDMYAQIVEDLQQSIVCFEESPQTKKLYRASGPAAQLLLSRVYLYMQDWDKAWVEASSFVQKNADLTNLHTHKENSPLLTQDNRELLFSHGHLNVQKILSAYTDDMCVSRDLYNLYEEDDARKTIYFTVHAQTDSVALNHKYIRGAHRSYVSDLFMLRNAEGYLNLAEAAAMLGKLDEASKAIHTLRNARIADYTPRPLDNQSLVQQIRNERRKELCFEGHRWFDLRRYAVNQTEPYSKDILRYYSVFDVNSRELIQTEIYRLPAGDPAYTFALPKSVVEFEQGQIDNPRNVRPYERLAN